MIIFFHTKVGCMIGFYVSTNPNMTGSSIYYESKIWTETPFLPAHEVLQFLS